VDVLPRAVAGGAPVLGPSPAWADRRRLPAGARSYGNRRRRS